jgi:hypothetical protein
MINNIHFKELSVKDISNHLLSNFIRYQKITKYWMQNSGNQKIINGEYTKDWDQCKKDEIVKYF